MVWEVKESARKKLGWMSHPIKCGAELQERLLSPAGARRQVLRPGLRDLPRHLLGLTIKPLLHWAKTHEAVGSLISVQPRLVARIPPGEQRCCRRKRSLTSGNSLYTSWWFVTGLWDGLQVCSAERKGTCPVPCHQHTPVGPTDLILFCTSAADQMRVGDEGGKLYSTRSWWNKVVVPPTAVCWGPI